jgi:hypothetical protein
MRHQISIGVVAAVVIAFLIPGFGMQLGAGNYGPGWWGPGITGGYAMGPGMMGSYGYGMGPWTMYREHEHLEDQALKRGSLLAAG